MRRASVAGCALLAALALVTAASGAIARDGGAAQSVTLSADSTSLAAQQSVRLRGSVSSREAGELVEIEVKDCGQPAFRGVKAATTGQGGEWSLEYWPGVSTIIRAVWKKQESIQIPVVQQVWVSLWRKRSTGELEVWTSGATHFWRKYVLFQRRASGSWKTVRRIVLTEQIDGGAGTTYSGRVNTGAIFRARVPKGTLVRAVLPRSQARPCYLTGVSNSLRTR